MNISTTKIEQAINIIGGNQFGNGNQFFFCKVNINSKRIIIREESL